VLLVSEEGLDGAAADAIGEASRALARMGSGGDAEVNPFVDVRYRGQSHETVVPYHPGEGWGVLAERFHRAHEERNGFARPGDPIEVVTVRAEAVGTPVVDWGRLPAPVPEGDPRRAARPVLTGEGEVTAAVWWRPALRAGTEIDGPAVIEEPDATTYLAPGEHAVVHRNGALEVSW
jgi:N-methylhydantoinase A